MPGAQADRAEEHDLRVLPVMSTSPAVPTGAHAARSGGNGRSNAQSVKSITARGRTPPSGDGGEPLFLRQMRRAVRITISRPLPAVAERVQPAANARARRRRSTRVNASPFENGLAMPRRCVGTDV
jgi:hypothetical protein